MFELLLMAQVTTADYVCWADFGVGPIDMSYMCGVSASAAPAALSEPGNTLASAGEEFVGITITELIPSIRECREAEMDRYIESYELVLDRAAIARITQECADNAAVVATYSSPLGRLEIIEDRKVGEFWVRLPDEESGYGPFARRSDANAWAGANYEQFF